MHTTHFPFSDAVSVGGRKLEMSAQIHSKHLAAITTFTMCVVVYQYVLQIQYIDSYCNRYLHTTIVSFYLRVDTCPELYGRQYFPVQGSRPDPLI